MMQMNKINELSALRDRLHSELRQLDLVIGELQSAAAQDRRALARFELGTVWGATKLSRFLGVSVNTARKAMQTDLADLTWVEGGHLRVRAGDVERRIAERRAAAGSRSAVRALARQADRPAPPACANAESRR